MPPTGTEDGTTRRHRVFFADDDVAVAAGYRHCRHCLRPQYRRWSADVEARTSAAGIDPGPLGLG